MICTSSDGKFEGDYESCLKYEEAVKARDESKNCKYFTVSFLNGNESLLVVHTLSRHDDIAKAALEGAFGSPYNFKDGEFESSAFELTYTVRKESQQAGKKLFSDLDRRYIFIVELDDVPSIFTFGDGNFLKIGKKESSECDFDCSCGCNFKDDAESDSNSKPDTEITGLNTKSKMGEFIEILENVLGIKPEEFDDNIEDDSEDEEDSEEISPYDEFIYAMFQDLIHNVIEREVNAKTHATGFCSRGACQRPTGFRGASDPNVIKMSSELKAHLDKLFNQ